MKWIDLMEKTWRNLPEDGLQNDYFFIRRIIEQQRGSTLDVDCGAGRLLLPLLKDGLKVEGVDSSADMLAICRAKASQAGVTPILYQQALQQLELPNQYRTIYIANGSLAKITEPIMVWETLQRLYIHLEDDGLLLFNLTWPFSTNGPLDAHAAEQLNAWGDLWWCDLPDGSLIAEQFKRLSIDRVEQLSTTQRRYQWIVNGKIVREELFHACERWYFKHEMGLMLRQIGFNDIQVRGNWTDKNFAEPHETLVFSARK
jgi:SAM-dependent methyltransferase